MKLSEMTDEQKGRWIAEKLGYSVQYHAQYYAQTSTAGAALCYHLKPPNAEYVWQGPCRIARSEAEVWADMIRDPVMSWILLEWLDSTSQRSWIEIRRKQHQAVTGEWLPLKMATADAVMLANGFREE